MGKGEIDWNKQSESVQQSDTGNDDDGNDKASIYWVVDIYLPLYFSHCSAQSSYIPKKSVCFPGDKTKILRDYLISSEFLKGAFVMILYLRTESPWGKKKQMSVYGSMNSPRVYCYDHFFWKNKVILAYVLGIYFYLKYVIKDR